MKKFLTLLAASVMIPFAAIADPISIDDHKSYHSLGCLILKECTDGVVRIRSLEDIKKAIPGANFDWYEGEIDYLLHAMDKIGIEVYIAEDKYFPPNHRGVYTPNGNTMFLNRSWMLEPHYLLAVIHWDAHIPQFWVETARNTYPENVVPWESEAMWAATQNNMTYRALLACGSDRQAMWEAYEPTPLTREWLVNEGWIKR